MLIKQLLGGKAPPARRAAARWPLSVRRGIHRLETLERRVLLSGSAGNLFVTRPSDNTIGEYTLAGSAVNASLVSGLSAPYGIAVSGSDLFVANYGTGTISEYTTSGAILNASLVTGLNNPSAIAVSGSDLFVANYNGTIGEYTTSGATINASLVSGPNEPLDIIAAGADLFVTSFTTSTIAEYTTSGATVNASLISGLSSPGYMVVSGPDLYVTNTSIGTIGEYTTSGATVNASLVSGLADPYGIALSGSNLFVSTLANTVGEYTTSGATVNASLISGLDALGGIVVQAPTTPGSADPAFNGGQPVPLGFAAQASAVTAGGQTLLAGLEPGSGTTGTQAVLEELNADGSIDSAFGTAGTVTDAATSDEAYYGVVTESNGTIVAAGTSNGDLLLSGYNADGSIDASFGAGGRVTVPIAGATDATAYGITTDASGNIVVVGSAGGQFLADRFTADGAQDPTFNDGSPLLFGTASDGDVLGKVAVQSDGDIVAAGASSGGVVVARLTPAGALDSTFGTGGIVTLNQLAAPDLLVGQPDYTEGLAIDSEGRILVANTSPGGDFATARLDASGSLDTTFGTGGVVTTDFGGTDDADFVGVQPDGSQIIVAGTSTSGGVVQEAIAAYTPSGQLDTTFGTAGKELLSTGLGAAPALALRPALLFPPQAEGIGAVVEQVFANLDGGKLVVGVGRHSSNSGDGAVQRLIVPAPTATPLPVGTLGASVSASLPAAVVGGAKAAASAVVTVTNPTSQTISGPVTVTLYASLGESLGGATQLLMVTPKLKLKAHRHTALRLRLSSFPSLPKGSYYLVASVKAPDGSTTGAAGASTTTISPAFKTVIASDVAPTPASVAPGKKASLALTLQNQGNVPVSGTATLAITASTDSSGAGGTTIATVPLKVKLKQGATGHYKVKFAVPPTLPAGRYYLAVNLNVAALGDGTAADGLAVSGLTIDVS